MNRITLQNIELSSDSHTFVTNHIEIGRSKSCDLVINQEFDQVSSVHGELILKDNKLFYKQLGKNNALIGKNVVNVGCEIHSGDVLALTSEGPNYLIRFENEESSFMLENFNLEKILVILLILSLLITILVLLT